MINPTTFMDPTNYWINCLFTHKSLGIWALLFIATTEILFYFIVKSNPYEKWENLFSYTTGNKFLAMMCAALAWLFLLLLLFVGEVIVRLFIIIWEQTGLHAKEILPYFGITLLIIIVVGIYVYLNAKWVEKISIKKVKGGNAKAKKKNGHI